MARLLALSISLVALTAFKAQAAPGDQISVPQISAAELRKNTTVDQPSIREQRASRPPATEAPAAAVTAQSPTEPEGAECVEPEEGEPRSCLESAPEPVAEANPETSLLQLFGIRSEVATPASRGRVATADPDAIADQISRGDSIDQGAVGQIVRDRGGN